MTSLFCFWNLCKGVFALSKTEVKKDVREMERNLNEDTDSDSSILSEDVLVSSYPVKPRKAPKVTVPLKPVITGPTDVEREYDGKTVDQTLSFIDAVRRSKKDLYSAECERERLEDQSLVSDIFLISLTVLWPFLLDILLISLPKSTSSLTGLALRTPLSDIAKLSRRRGTTSELFRAFTLKHCGCKWV